MEKEKKKATFVEWVYPPISDKLSAQKAARYGVWASLFCSGATILIVLINAMGANLFGANILSLIDAVIFGLIALGIYKMSRIAAIIGLILYIVERVFMLESQGTYGNTFQVIVLTLMFINSIRGTFAYHKQSEEAVSASNDRTQLTMSDLKVICPKCGSDKTYKGQQCLNCGEIIEN